MTGEYATATLHFVKGGVYIECEDLDYGAFCTDGKGLMKSVQAIDDLMNPDSRFFITKKGKKSLSKLKKQDNERRMDD